MSERAEQALEHFQRVWAEIHRPIEDENVLACIAEIKEVFQRRGIATDCTFSVLADGRVVTVHYRNYSEGED